MSRNARRRRQARRRRAQAAKDRTADRPAPQETRDPRTRWRQLRARGGRTLSFRPTGVRVPVDLDAADAEHALHVALARRLHLDPGEA